MAHQNKMQIEMWLIELNKCGHLEMRRQLRYILNTVYLTAEQVRAVNEEIAWRSNRIDRLHEASQRLRIKGAQYHGHPTHHHHVHADT